MAQIILGLVSSSEQGDARSLGVAEDSSARFNRIAGPHLRLYAWLLAAESIGFGERRFFFPRSQFRPPRCSAWARVKFPPLAACVLT